MPSPEEILRSLQKITENYLIAAFAWHLWIYSFVALLLLSRTKPSSKPITFLLTIPILSVAVIAALELNSFNAIAFTIIFLTLNITRLKIADEPISFSTSPFLRTVGIILVMAGIFYPHFSSNYALLVISAPMGLIPCPTLLLVIGFTLLFAKLPKQWIIILLIASLFYGFIGVFRLKVFIDLLLLVAAFALCWEFIPAKPLRRIDQKEKRLLYE